MVTASLLTLISLSGQLPFQNVLLAALVTGALGGFVETLGALTGIPIGFSSGMDFAGVVESLGADVMSFKPGDRVFGMCPSRSNGAHAEHVCIPETGPIAVMPSTR